MATVVINDEHFKDIANAIRKKTGESTTYKPREMANAISAISNVQNTGDVDSFLSKNITQIFNNKVTSVGYNAFYYDTTITSVSFPLATTLQENAFWHCSNLETANFASVKDVGSKAFKDCYGLKNVYMPSEGITLYSDAFNTCTSLEKIEFNSLIKIWGGVFDYCSSLTALILRSTSNVMTICVDTNGFTKTPIASGTGYIYVPSALIDTYKADSFWKQYINQLRAIEDYPDICG